jgi:hypothetical protein
MRNTKFIGAIQVRTSGIAKLNRAHSMDRESQKLMPEKAEISSPQNSNVKAEMRQERLTPI